MSKFFIGTLTMVALLFGQTICAQDDAEDFKSLPFDHINTGFELIGSHASVACENCHVGGRFGGTPRQCADCHSLNGRINATPKAATHIPTTEFCSACHQETFWDDVFHMDHTQAFGLCTGCHNNILAIGTASVPGHPPIGNLNCDFCHGSDIDWCLFTPISGQECK